jgi:hypothetical protein
MSKLQDLKDDLSRMAHGITKGEAEQAGVCVSCREPALPKCKTDAGRREYRISGLCEVCWDNLFNEELNQAEAEGEFEE